MKTGMHTGILAACLFLLSCASQKEGINKNNFLLESQFKDFIPISPIDFEDEVVIFIDSLKRTDTMSIKELSANKSLIIQFLPNETVYATVRKNDHSATAKYGPATMTAEPGSYTVTLDYAKFTTLKIIDTKGGCSGFSKVGVGMRINAQITTLKANVDVSSLFGLGIAAKTNQLKGQLSIDVIGMESGKITDLITLPVDISEASIQTALQAMSAIKSKIYDRETRLYPQILAVKRSNGIEPCSVFEILNSLDVPSLKTYKDGREDGKAIGILIRALEDFNAKNNRYPNDLKELQLDEVINFLGAKRLNYRISKDQGYILTFAGADGVLGTQDDKVHKGRQINNTQKPNEN